MAGVDWAAALADYRQLVDRFASPADFADVSPEREQPEELTRNAIRALSEAALADYNRCRCVWHANLGLIKTPQLGDSVPRAHRRPAAATVRKPGGGPSAANGRGGRE